MTQTSEQRRLRHNELARAYYAANKDKIAAYQAANKDKIAARHAAYYAARRKAQRKATLDEELKRIQWGVYQV
jgi:hypothetical protein